MRYCRYKVHMVHTLNWWCVLHYHEITGYSNVQMMAFCSLDAYSKITSVAYGVSLTPLPQFIMEQKWKFLQTKVFANDFAETIAKLQWSKFCKTFDVYNSFADPFEKITKLQQQTYCETFDVCVQGMISKSAKQLTSQSTKLIDQCLQAFAKLQKSKLLQNFWWKLQKSKLLQNFCKRFYRSLIQVIGAPCSRVGLHAIHLAFEAWYQSMMHSRNAISLSWNQRLQ